MTNKVKPISPEEAKKQKVDNIPDFVLEIVNDLIVANLDPLGKARIRQSEIIEAICNIENVAAREVYANKWLDFEDIYREMGWNVHYDKPAYNESYPATFSFTPAKKLT